MLGGTMDKEIISGKEAVAVFVLFLIGDVLVIGTSHESRQDAWLSVLIALTMFIPLILACSRIVSLYPQKGLYDIVISIFGNFIGKVIILVYVLYAILLGAIVIRIFSEFINIVTMPETPQMVIQIFLLIFCAWMVKSGIESMGRWSKFVLPIVIITILITTSIALKDMHVSYLKPVGGSGISNIMQGAFTAFSYPLAESVLILPIYGSVKKGENPKRIFFAGTAIGTVLMLMAYFRNILVLGITSYGMHIFPSYTAISVISMGEFFTRIEVLVGLLFLLGGYVKISVCLFDAAIGMVKIFNLENYKAMAYPAGLLTLTLAIIINKNAAEFFTWEKIYKFVAIPYQVILPLIILAAAEIKNFLNRVKSS